MTLSLSPFATLVTSSIPLALSAWRLEEEAGAEVVTRPEGAVVAAKPAAPATARMVSPGCFAVGIARSGAAYADC